MIKNFIQLSDFTGPQLSGLIDRTIAEKPAYLAGTGATTLPRKTLALLFEKPSLRTRVSFEVAMTQLGGRSTYLDQMTVGLGQRESVKDVARVLGRMCDGIMARTFSHDVIKELAEYASVPVINGLTDYCHPCQAMADMVTVKEHFGDLAGRTLVFVGDGNNVARSLAVACIKLGMKFVLACPQGYQLEESFFEILLLEHPEADCQMIHDADKAVANADVIYADTWVSMGQEEEKAQRVDAFKGFQINAELLAKAPDNAIVLHCLPAYRDYEITDEIFEANATHILNEAENRLHFQRTLLNALLADGGIE
ncbi:MAG: ornithine carbamoyltransferase [Phycisphaerae bacterium]|nr:ornithine carbamoyltransferase [Phycisphaerae bacterium]